MVHQTNTPHYPFARSFIYACVLFLSLAVVSGCASKGRAIQTGAAQFEAASLSAISTIDTLRQREVTGPERTPEEASDFFVKFVLISESLSNEDLETAIDPSANPTGSSEASWQAFLQNLRNQYTSFAVVFSSLDRGGLFARPSVEAAIPILNKLIAQMAAFAKSLGDHPAEFVRERAALAEELEFLRLSAIQAADVSADELADIAADVDTIRERFPGLDIELRSAEARLRVIMAAEEQLTREAIQLSLTAASLGMELRPLLQNFGELSVDDISEGIASAIRLGSTIPGLDLTALKAQTDDVVKRINADPDIRNLFDTVLGTIGTARD